MPNRPELRKGCVYRVLLAQPHTMRERPGHCACKQTLCPPTAMTGVEPPDRFKPAALPRPAAFAVKAERERASEAVAMASAVRIMMSPLVVDF
jgi:hypothetical protein